MALRMKLLVWPNLQIGGPEVRLKTKPAEAISLAVHELATNAVKYGALNAKRGQTRVWWERVPNGNTDSLKLE